MMDMVHDSLKDEFSELRAEAVQNQDAGGTQGREVESNKKNSV